MTKPRKSSRTRLKLVLFCTIAIFIYLIGRLGKYQIVKGKELKQEALQQWTKSIDIKPKRGIIYDRTGKKLAVSVGAYTVYATPADIDEKEETAKTISQILDLEEEEVLDKLSQSKREEKIKQWITRDEANELRKEKLKGISIVEDNKRYYPNGNFASYILGFTNIDSDGLDGIESTYDEYLTGIPGKWMKMTDAGNRQLPYDGEKIYNPQEGMSLVLTLDETIQYFVEKAAHQALVDNDAKNVSIIIMEPKTGDIIAMSNKPDYDPNNPREPLDPKIKSEWEGLSAEDLTDKWYEMWRNISISDIYEPGSTFKLITAAAALEENTTSLDSHYYCNGFVRDIKGSKPLKCVRWYNPHGSQSLREAMNNSCNVAFVNIARELGKENLLKYIRGFGFGEKTNIDLLGEQVGIIPANADRIREINLATMSYGHGIAITPIQLLNAVATMANGGDLMKPRIVKEMIDENGELVNKIEPKVVRKVISKKTSDTILSLMETVVSDGSGSRAGVDGYRIGGKTGTAQKVGDKGYEPGKYIASFVGVAPIDDPQFAILVIVDEPKGSIYGGSVAAPVAHDVLAEVFNYMEIAPVYDDEEKEKENEIIVVPDVRKMLIEEAGKKLTELGFKYTTEYVDIDDSSRVVNQFPMPNTEVQKGSIIDLYVDPETAGKNTMPFLIGKTKEEIIDILDDLSLPYELKGEGLAVIQSPVASEELDSDSKIIIEFE